MKCSRALLKCSIATSWIAASAVGAQPTQSVDLPPAASIPWADLPIYLADQGIRQNDFLGAVRYMPLSENAKDYFSLGGEVRYQYQDYERTLLGVDGKRNPNSMLQQRLRISGDLNLDNGLRVFAELGDNREFFSERDTPLNRGKTDVQQMFVELSASAPTYGTAQLRLGRFVMPLGSLRLVGLREGVNHRYTYDGAKVTWLTPANRVGSCFPSTRPASIPSDSTTSVTGPRTSPVCMAPVCGARWAARLMSSPTAWAATARAIPAARVRSGAIPMACDSTASKGAGTMTSRRHCKMVAVAASVFAPGH